MTHQAARIDAPIGSDSGEQLVQLCQVLALVEELAGRTASPCISLDTAARLSADYADAMPITRRRYDRLSAATAGSAAAGLESLLLLQERQCPIAPAASRLAEELRRALRELSTIL